MLDSSFVIDVLRGDRVASGRFQRLFEDGDQPFVNEIVACELWSGAPTDEDPDLLRLLDAVEFVQPSIDAAQRAGRWRAHARGRGRTLSMADALIAAAADALGATVLTRNQRDFSLTPVRLESY